MLDPNYYSEDEILYIPNEYFNPYHEDSIGATFNPYKTEKSKYEMHAAFAAAAGIYLIPGIGEVALTVTGAVVIGGVTIKAGSWLYNKVAAYFTARAYGKAKKNGTKTKDHSTTSSGLSRHGDSYSSKDRVKNGKVIQRRYYDKNGNADMDIDYTNHGNPKKHPKVPHRHDWKKGKRGSGY